MLPPTRFSRAVERVLHRFDDALSWIWMVLLAVIVLNVVMRYAFGQGRIEFEEIQWHLYATGMLLGLAACYVDDAHVRVDVLQERFSPRTRAWIELYGTLLLLLPFIALMLIYSVPFVIHSYVTGEVSVAPGGLALRWMIKAMLPLGFLLLLVAAIARLTRVWAFLFGPRDAG